MTSSSSASSTSDFVVLLVLLDKLDQAGLLRATLIGASRFLRPYDWPEPRPGALLVLQNTWNEYPIVIFTIILI